MSKYSGSIRVAYGYRCTIVKDIYGRYHITLYDTAEHVVEYHVCIDCIYINMLINCFVSGGFKRS